MAMPRKTYSWFVMGIMVSSLFEIGSFFGGIAPIWTPLPQVLAFLILMVSLVKVIVTQRKELDALYHPKFDLKVEEEYKLQRDSIVIPGSWDAGYWRIAITNNSNVTLKQCRVMLESWTFESMSLNRDTPLIVKDENVLGTDISGKDRKQFNFLINKLRTGTDILDLMKVQAPNLTNISSAPGGYSAMLRVTADNMDTRRYMVLLLIDAIGIRITKVTPQ